MAEQVKLSDDDLAAISKLDGDWRKTRRHYRMLESYYEGEQRLDRMGLAVPDELALFRTLVNVPRIAVDEPVRRQALRGFQRAGKPGIDKGLQEAWTANNLTSQSILGHCDARLYGRGFVGVSTNPENAKMPRITVESPEGFAVDIDPLNRRIRRALRRYTDGTKQMATYYTPTMTRWLERANGKWTDAAEPDFHDLGVVALVMLLNRARTGRFEGVSEMKDVLGKTDSIARTIMNMEVGAEALAWPKRWAAGVGSEDFKDKNGNVVPKWEAYMTVLMTTKNESAKFGEFAAADLANFYNTVNAFLRWCALELGLPLRFLAQEATNPATEGAIKADESRLNANVELKNAFDGDSWSWVMGLYERFRLGKFGRQTNGIQALWFDPATPTIAQRADAVLKLFQAGVLSRQGAWDEMGWDETRKTREMAYFAEEAAADPLSGLSRELKVPADPAVSADGAPSNN